MSEVRRVSSAGEGVQLVRPLCSSILSGRQVYYSCACTLLYPLQS